MSGIKVKTVVWGFIFIVCVITLCQYLGIAPKVLQIIDNPGSIPIPGK